MGSWNGTCAISNLHITAGQKVAVFLLLENKDKKSFCYSNAMYDLCPIPFYGEYNDYGAVENCRGFGMNIVLESLREQLYEFGQGPNSVHDNPVNKDNLTIESLFEADDADRLGIQEMYGWNNDEHNCRNLEQQRLESGLTDSQQFELDRLANKIKQKDTFRQVTHVIIHGDVFDDIMNKWYIKDYVGGGKGTHGHNKNYNYMYFKDIADSIPEYIANMKASIEAIKLIEGSQPRPFPRTPGRDSWDSPNLATRWLLSIRGNTNEAFGLINVDECIREYFESEDWDGLTSFVTETLTGLWVDSFMRSTRKAWAQTPGKGSQNSDELGYRVLIDSMTRILDTEKADYVSWEDEDD